MTDTQTRAARASRVAASAAQANIDAAVETLRAEIPSSFVDLFEKSLARTKDMRNGLTEPFKLAS